jgi:hypothetical protein
LDPARGFVEEPSAKPMSQFDWTFAFFMIATLAMAAAAIGVLLFAM